jgi:hypothetical protein
LEEKVDQLHDTIGDLSGEIRELRAERDALTDASALREERDRIKTELVELQIEKSKVDEEHDRRERETLHKVGLERKRQEFEADAAKREAKLEVREEALDSAKDLVQDKLDFMQERMTEEIKYLKESVIEAVIKLVPTVTVEKSISLSDAADRRRKAASE